MIPTLVALPGFALAVAGLSMQAPQAPARGCAPVAVYLYAKLLGAPLTYDRCVERFAPSAAGASLRDMEGAGVALGVPLEPRAVAWPDLRGWTEPVIFLAAPRYAARMPDGSPAQVGHYLAARPLPGDLWQVFDYPADHPAVLGTRELGEYLGVPATEEVIVLAAFPPDPSAGGRAPGVYRPSRVVAPGGPRGAVLDLGMVEAPAQGEAATITADISGRGVGDSVEVRVDLINTGAEAVDLAPGVNSCGCASLALPDRRLDPGAATTLRGLVRVSESMRRTPEYAEVRILRSGGPATLRLLASGQADLRAIVEPPVAAFGPTAADGPPLRQIVRVTAPESSSFDLAPPGTPSPASPFSARVVSRPEPGVVTIEITLAPGAVGAEGSTPARTGRIRGAITLIDSTGDCPAITIPAEAILRPAIHADPGAAVVTGTVSVSLRFLDEGGTPRAPVAVQGLTGVSATLGPDGSCLLSRERPGSPRVQSATILFGDGARLSVPVLVRD